MTAPSTSLFNLSLGSLSAQGYIATRATPLLFALQQAPGVRFDGSRRVRDGTGHASAGAADGRRGSGANGEQRPLGKRVDEDAPVQAHRAGVAALVVDRFEGRW